MLLACQPDDLELRASLEAAGLNVVDTLDWSSGDVSHAHGSLASSDVLLSQRFHAALAGALAGAQVYSFGDDPKLSDLQEMLPGMVTYLRDIRSGELAQTSAVPSAHTSETVALASSRINADLKLLFGDASIRRSPSMRRRAGSLALVLAAVGMRVPVITRSIAKRALAVGNSQ